MNSEEKIDALFKKSARFVNDKFPRLADNNRRITVLAIMKMFLTMEEMEIEQEKILLAQLKFQAENPGVRFEKHSKP